MDEIIDMVDEITGKKIGKTISKNEAHKRGIWHSAIHILIINKDKTKVLLQKRCEQKKLYPNIWDISVGGHISTNEEPLTSAKRELQEELGLNPDNYEFIFLEKVKEELNNNIIKSKEFVYTYLISSDIDLKDIKVQKEEVSEVKWVTKEELNNLINDSKLIPHQKVYKILNKTLK